MSSITSKQRAHLRSLAHPLKPILQVGTGGVSDAFVTSLAEAFNTRELLKVKVLEGDVREVAEQIGTQVEGVTVAQTIGRTIVLYRPDPDEPEIKLP